MKTSRLNIKSIIAASLLLAAFVGLTPSAEAGFLKKIGREFNRAVDDGKKVIKDIDRNVVQPVVDAGKKAYDTAIKPVVEWANSAGGLRELAGILGAILSGGGTAGGGDTGGGGGGDGGVVEAAALRLKLSYSENQIDILEAKQRIDRVSLLKPNATVLLNHADVSGVKAGKLAITQTAKEFTADMGEGSILDVNGLLLLGVQGTSLTFNQEAQGGYWRIAPHTTVRMNTAEMQSGKYGTVAVDQFLDMPRLEVQGGTTALNQFRAR